MLVDIASSPATHAPSVRAGFAANRFRTLSAHEIGSENSAHLVENVCRDEDKG